MGTDCTACACNDQKETDDSTALYLDKKNKDPNQNPNEKE
jgi:hypothetical protein